MRKTLSLRRALVSLILATGILPLAGFSLLLLFWLTPAMESQVASHNQALAVAHASLTERYLTTPQFALRALTRRSADFAQSGHLQAALDSLISSTDLFEAIYIVDRRSRVVALATPHDAPIQHDDFLGLDLTGSAILLKGRETPEGAWSDAYLSPISNRSVAATAIPAGDKLVIGEISLHRLSEFVRALSRDHTTVTILDRRGLVVAHPDARVTAQQVNYSHLAILQRGEDAVTDKFLLDGSEVIGSLADVNNLDWHVLVTRPLASVQQPIVITAILLGVFTVLALVISWRIGLTFADRVSRGFEQLADLSEQLAAGRYPSDWPALQLLEAQLLNDNMLRMSDAVRQRETELRDLNQTLEQKVEERTASLQQAQENLVRSEKLASLGSLVAGIAHELNTPIGNGLMAASALEDKSKQFARQASEGLRRSELEHYVQYNREAAGLVVRNLDRAAELISSFKQVAIDQTTWQRRAFDLAELLHEISTTLAPTLRKTRCDVQITVPPGLKCDSYPGPLGQVLVNLLTNAAVHGYRDQPGTIAMNIREIDADQVELTVRDHGAGIAREHLGRVFDPFFTTRLGEGGSGLGLHICHNIVTNLLGGDITVSSEPGEGTGFTLTLPRVAPAVAAE